MKEISLTDLKGKLSSNTDYIIIKTLFSACTYPKSDEKIDDIIRYYLEAKSTDLLGILVGEDLIGLIGIEINNDKGLIKHISVLPEYQSQGIGSKVVKTLPIKYDLKTIEAYTDVESINFYQKLGFMTQLLEDNPYLIDRYLCVLKA